MTDYDYDKNRVNLDDNDSTKNSATDVAGYSITVTPQENWPGRDGKRGQADFDPKVMNQVAQWLEDQANDLSNLPTTVGQRLAGVQFGPQTWPSAKALTSAHTQVQGAVTKYTTELVTNLQQAAASIRAAAKSYKESDDNSAATSKNQSANL